MFEGIKKVNRLEPPNSPDRPWLNELISLSVKVDHSIIIYRYQISNVELC